MKDFKLIEKFPGYQNKKDISNVDPSFLITGSHDVLVNDGEKVVTRTGYTLYGQANTNRTPITSSHDWDSSTSVSHRLRFNDDELEYSYIDSNGDVSWNRLKDGFAVNSKLRFAEWWSAAEVKDLLLFVDGTSNIHMWSGGVATVASNTATTLTKEGTETWAESRFLIVGTRKVIVGGVEYEYTGGEGTTTLTGLTGLPAFTVGDVVIQAVRTTANIPAAAVDNDIIFVNKNQVYIADENRRDVYISKNTDYTDYTYTSPRLPGEGAVLTLDSSPRGFVDQEGATYISAGNNDWYQTIFTMSSDNTKEALTIEKLKSGPQQGAISHEGIGKIKNSVIYVSNEPTLDTLGRLESINTPQSKPLSDPIKKDFDSYDFTNCHVKYHKNQAFISVPREGLVLIYDIQNGYWQPPQRMSISRFSIINGEIYGHSASVAETYKIFDQNSHNDNGNAISHEAIFAYRNFGTRHWKKRFDEYFHEGYIYPNTSIDVTYKYEYQGSSTEKTKTIDNNTPGTLFGKNINNSFGSNPLGQSPLGSVLGSSENMKKFRNIHTLSKDGFYEFLLSYSSYDIDYAWEILAHGPNVIMSTADNVDIKT